MGDCGVRLHWIWGFCISAFEFPLEWINFSKCYWAQNTYDLTLWPVVNCTRTFNWLMHCSCRDFTSGCYDQSFLLLNALMLIVGFWCIAGKNDKCWQILTIKLLIMYIMKGKMFVYKYKAVHHCMSQTCLECLQFLTWRLMHVFIIKSLYVGKNKSKSSKITHSHITTWSHYPKVFICNIYTYIYVCLDIL